MENSRNEAGRLSLRRIDALLQGELPAEAAAELRRELDQDPAARAYLARQESLRSSLTEADLRTALARGTARAGGRGPTRMSAWLAAAGALFGNAPSGAPFGIRGALAGGALAVLVLGLTVWTLRPGPEALAPYRAKGGGQAEVLLQAHGKDYRPGDLVPARAGDTLEFAYRSGDPVHVEVWYREDGREAAPFSGSGGFRLPTATSWTPVGRRIRLEGSWTRQEVWILLSPAPLPPEEARSAVAGRPPRGTRVLAYRLASPAGGGVP